MNTLSLPLLASPILLNQIISSLNLNFLQQVDLCSVLNLCSYSHFPLLLHFVPFQHLNASLDQKHRSETLGRWFAWGSWAVSNIVVVGMESKCSYGSSSESIPPNGCSSRIASLLQVVLEVSSQRRTLGGGWGRMDRESWRKELCRLGHGRSRLLLGRRRAYRFLNC